MRITKHLAPHPPHLCRVAWENVSRLHNNPLTDTSCQIQRAFLALPSLRDTWKPVVSSSATQSDSPYSNRLFAFRDASSTVSLSHWKKHKGKNDLIKPADIEKETAAENAWGWEGGENLIWTWIQQWGWMRVNEIHCWYKGPHLNH